MSAGLSRRRSLDPGDWEYALADLPQASEGHVDPRNWFKDPSKPFELEIGSGKGTFLVQQAAMQASTNFLGIEWAGAYAHHAADRLRRHQLENVRMLLGDATEFITHWCPDSFVDVVHLYFSDPWPKTRHHKRRVIQDSTLAQFERVLVPGGELRMVTDHDDLWEWYEEHATRHADLFEHLDFNAPGSAGPSELVGTNYERKFRPEGRAFRAMTLRKWA